MLAIVTIPQPGTNNIAIADELFKRFEAIKKDMPADIRLEISYDQTKFIRKSISEVKETLLISFILVVLIIYLFFRDWIIAIRPLLD